MNGAEALVGTLCAHGVTTVFGVPGESYLSVLEAMREHQDILRFINTRHESGATFAADAYARMHCTPGIAFVTRGPGATNAAIGIHTAKQDSTPLVMFVGQVPTRQLGRESFQEIDYTRMFGEVAKAVIEPLQASEMAAATAQALAIAMDGRPGPVIVPVPEDVGTNDAGDAPLPAPAARRAIVPDQQTIEAAAKLISEARHPVILAGEMVNFERCNDALTALAERIGAGVVAGFRRQGVIDSSHPAYLGHFGLALAKHQQEFWQDVDLVIGLGSRMDAATSLDFDLVRPDQTLVQVFPDAEGLVQNGPAVAIQSDTAPAIDALAAQLPDSPPAARLAWRDRVNAIYRNWTTAEANPSLGTVDLAAVASTLATVMPDDGILTCDAGNFSTWFQRHGKFRHARALAGPAAGAMGYSVPGAFGAKVAEPARTVVAVVGDGGFMMTGQELISAVENDVPIVVIVCDNSAYGTIAMHQYVRYGAGSQYGTLSRSPDFAAAARAWGAQAWTVRDTSGFEPALREALACKQPALIHLLTDLRDLSGSGLKMDDA